MRTPSSMASHPILIGPALVLACAGPAFAQGEDCSTATPILGVGAFPFDTSTAVTEGFDGSGTCTGGADIQLDRFFQFSSGDVGIYTFDTIGSSFDTQLSVHAGVGCAAICLAHDDDGAGNLLSRVRVDLAAGQEVLVQVGGFLGDSGAGLLNVSFQPPACTSIPDDALEENDDCGMEIPLGSGLSTGLLVHKTDWDYYALTVADGATLQVDLTFLDAEGDIDMFLYDQGACASFAAGNVGAAGALAFGFSSTDNETLMWTNTSGVTASTVLKVNVFPPSTTGDCNTYDMAIAGATDGDIGSNYCDSAVPNSTGLASVLNASGSTLASDNNLTLSASNLPDGQFMFFVGSQTQGLLMNPGGSQGDLCVLGTIARFNRVREVGVIAGGGFQLSVDLTDVPEPGSPGAIFPGETWNFQGWHRDTFQGLPTSNFTNGLSILFQ